MLPPFTSASHDGDLGCFVRNIILNSIFQKGQFIIPDIASRLQRHDNSQVCLRTLCGGYFGKGRLFEDQ